MNWLASLDDRIGAFLYWLVVTDVVWHVSVLEAIWITVAIIGVALNARSSLKSQRVVNNLFAEEREGRTLPRRFHIIANRDRRNHLKRLVVEMLFVLMGAAAGSNPANPNISAAAVRSSLTLAFVLFTVGVLMVWASYRDLQDTAEIAAEIQQINRAYDTMPLAEREAMLLDRLNDHAGK